ncbi:unnamed protein product [Sphenostylis stenocarpa]|uniref:Uncharacterized protein n=1 Tax=Sphenostylis stenocarpa TaxID=92480 RepID=A0AA86RYY5_9FABA|nr:unnamed protein product [Sphenostylis stenocarpa]
MAESFMDHQSNQSCREEKEKMVINTLAPNGGNGEFSYSKNSYFQKQSLGVEESKIEEEIHKKLDVKKLASASNMIIRVVDLGCATGPNTFMNAHNVVEAINLKYQSQCPNTEIKPEFQVFFNTIQRFNTLFTSLPQERNYFASGVPGSFYNQLKMNSPSWNKGRIHHSGASKEVVDAYATQFAEDAGKLLDARAMELVPGGMLVIVMPSFPYGMPYSEVINGMLFDYMGSILLDLSKEGLFDESKIDSFNFPYYASNPAEMTKVVEKNGRFSIERMELTNPVPWLKSMEKVIPDWIIHVRVVMEAIFTSHIGEEVTHEMFQRLTKHVLDKREVLETKYNFLLC